MRKRAGRCRPAVAVPLRHFTSSPVTTRPQNSSVGPLAETGLVVVDVSHRPPERHDPDACVLEVHRAVLEFASMNTSPIGPRRAPSSATVTRKSSPMRRAGLRIDHTVLVGLKANESATDQSRRLSAIAIAIGSLTSRIRIDFNAFRWTDLPQRATRVYRA